MRKVIIKAQGAAREKWRSVVDVVDRNSSYDNGLRLGDNELPRRPVLTTRPAFGTALDEYLSATGQKISIVIRVSIACLLENLEEEGLFRIPGSTSKVKKLKHIFDTGITSSDLDEFICDPHSVAGTLKSYLRELPSSLLTRELYPEWLNAAKITKFEGRLQALYNVLYQLPKENFDNLLYLVKFLSTLCSHSDMNKMTPQNIAIAMSPSFFSNVVSAEEEDASAHGFMHNMSFTGYHGVIITSLVSYAEWFFQKAGFSDVVLTTFPMLLEEMNSFIKPTVTSPILNNCSSEPSSPVHNGSPITVNGSPINQPHQGAVVPPLRRKKPPAPRPPTMVASTEVTNRTTVESESPALSITTMPRKSSLKLRNSALSAVESSSSNETVNSNEDKTNSKSQQLQIYRTGSLDRKALMSRTVAERGKQGDRKSLFIPQNKVIERPQVPPPPVPSQNVAKDAVLRKSLELPTSSSMSNDVSENRKAVPPRPARAIDLLKQKQKSLEDIICDRQTDYHPPISPNKPKLYPSLDQMTRSLESQLDSTAADDNPIQQITVQNESYDNQSNSNSVSEEQITNKDEICKRGSSTASILSDESGANHEEKLDINSSRSKSTESDLSSAEGMNENTSRNVIVFDRDNEMELNSLVDQAENIQDQQQEPMSSLIEAPLKPPRRPARPPRPGSSQSSSSNPSSPPQQRQSAPSAVHINNNNNEVEFRKGGIAIGIGKMKSLSLGNDDNGGILSDSQPIMIISNDDKEKPVQRLRPPRPPPPLCAPTNNVLNDFNIHEINEHRASVSEDSRL